VGRYLFKSALFTVGFCSVSTVITTIWEYENLTRGKKILRNLYDQFRFDLSTESNNKLGGWRNEINRKWNEQTESQKVYWGICFLNCAVQLFFLPPALRPFMFRYFAHSPTNPSLLPMILSTFSHANLLHLAVNMFVLRNFSANVCDRMGKEQFVNFYLCSGVVSSFVGGGLKVMRGVVHPSMGASGAILAVLGYFCCIHPDAQLQVILIPYSFSAEQCLIGMAAFDTLGVMLRWSIMDHGAHLGGLGFGYLYYHFGAAIWERRVQVAKAWHQLRMRMQQE